MSKTKEKLPLSSMLKAIDCRDKTFFKKLSAEQQKLFSSWTITRFISSASGIADIKEWYLLMTNEIVNHNSKDLRLYPDLQYLLLTIVGSGSEKQFHPWIPPGSKEKNTKTPLLDDILHDYYSDLEEQEFDVVSKINDLDDYISMAKQLGLDEKEIKEITKQFKKLERS